MCDLAAGWSWSSQATGRVQASCSDLLDHALLSCLDSTTPMEVRATTRTPSPLFSDSTSNVLLLHWQPHLGDAKHRILCCVCSTVLAFATKQGFGRLEPIGKCVTCCTMSSGMQQQQQHERLLQTLLAAGEVSLQAVWYMMCSPPFSSWCMMLMSCTRLA